MARKLWLIMVISGCFFSISNVNAVSDPSLVLHWSFDDTTADSSGSGMNATPYGSPSYATGVSGSALSSGGGDCFYSTSASGLPLGATDSWTMNLWVYTDSVPTDWMVAVGMGAKPYGTGGASRAIYASSGKIVFTDGGGSNFLSTGVAWDIGKWQMVTATYDGTDVKLYKNAFQIGSKAFSFATAASQLRVPTNPGWGNYFIGEFDELQIWNKALSASEIEALIIPGAIPGFGTPSLVSWYTMNDPNSMGVVPDHSENGNDAPFTGYTGDIGDWVVDGAMKFDGAQKMTLPATVSQLPAYSVSFWLKAGWESYNTAFYHEKGTSGSEFIIRGDVDYTNGKGMLKIYSKDYWWGLVYSLTIADAGSFLNNEWNHVAVVADGVDVMLYINGEFLDSVAYQKTDYKEGLVGYVGYYSGESYIGSSTTAYVSDFMLWDGALSPKNLAAMVADSNLNGDLYLDEEDLKLFASDWTADNSVGDVINSPVDDFEAYPDSSYLAGTWDVYASQSYTGTGTLAITNSAQAGTQALSWNYDLPATVDGGNYTSIVFSIGESMDISNYEYASLYLNRHAGNSEEGLLYLKFIDSTDEVVAESWAYTTVNPAGQWEQWLVDFDNLSGYQGVGSVDKSVLSDVTNVMIGCGSGSNDQRGGTIDFDTITLIDLPGCSATIDADFNGDCKSDILDYAMFASDWLEIN